VNQVHVLGIAKDHPAFAGHFPGRPILPGALLLDEVLHLIAEDRDLDLKEWQVSSVKFLASVGPGEVLIVEHAGEADGAVRITVHVESRPALTGTLTRIASPKAPA
jgi:3-hydroxyacyl-[acyl-carrier-protein] dehydratase